MCLCEGIVQVWHVFVWKYCTRVTYVCVKVLYQHDMCLCEGILPAWHVFVWRYCTSVTCVCVKVLYKCDMCLCEGIVLAWHVFVWRYCTRVTCVCVKVLCQRMVKWIYQLYSARHHFRQPVQNCSWPYHSIWLGHWCAQFLDSLLQEFAGLCSAELISVKVHWCWCV